jgi:hypothetical protein
MEWTVVWLRGAGNLAGYLAGANGAECRRQIGRAEGVTASVEMRLQGMRVWRGFDRGARNRRYGHTTSASDSEMSIAVEDRRRREDDKNG